MILMSVKHEITAEALRGDGFRTLHAGDDYDYKFTINRGGSPLNLSGSSKIWFTVKEDAIQGDTDAKLQLTSDSALQIEITDPVAGEFTVKFRSSTTEDIEGEWLYDLQIKIDDGTVLTVAYGAIEFLTNITRSVT